MELSSTIALPGNRPHVTQAEMFPCPRGMREGCPEPHRAMPACLQYGKLQETCTGQHVEKPFPDCSLYPGPRTPPSQCGVGARLSHCEQRAGSSEGSPHRTARSSHRQAAGEHGPPSTQGVWGQQSTSTFPWIPVFLPFSSLYRQVQASAFCWAQDSRALLPESTHSVPVQFL